VKITLEISEKLYEAVQRNTEASIEEIQFNWDDMGGSARKENLDLMKQFKSLWDNAKEIN